MRPPPLPLATALQSTGLISYTLVAEKVEDPCRGSSGRVERLSEGQVTQLEDSCYAAAVRPGGRHHRWQLNPLCFLALPPTPSTALQAAPGSGPHRNWQCNALAIVKSQRSGAGPGGKIAAAFETAGSQVGAAVWRHLGRIGNVCRG